MAGIASGKPWSRIGAEPAPTSAAAPGVWGDLNEVSENVAAGTWPAPPSGYYLMTTTYGKTTDQDVISDVKSDPVTGKLHQWRAGNPSDILSNLNVINDYKQLSDFDGSEAVNTTQGASYGQWNFQLMGGNGIYIRPSGAGAVYFGGGATDATSTLSGNGSGNTASWAQWASDDGFTTGNEGIIYGVNYNGNFGVDNRSQTGAVVDSSDNFYMIGQPYVGVIKSVLGKFSWSGSAWAASSTVSNDWSLMLDSSGHTMVWGYRLCHGKIWMWGTQATTGSYYYGLAQAVTDAQGYNTPKYLTTNYSGTDSIYCQGIVPKNDGANVYALLSSQGTGGGGRWLGIAELTDANAVQSTIGLRCATGNTRDQYEPSYPRFEIDSSGNFYVIVPTFDTSDTSDVSLNIIKISSAGVKLWERSIFGTVGAGVRLIPRGVTIDDDDVLILNGITDPTTAYGNSTAFLARIPPNGGTDWSSASTWTTSAGTYGLNYTTTNDWTIESGLTAIATTGGSVSTSQTDYTHSAISFGSGHTANVMNLEGSQTGNTLYGQEITV